MTAPPPTRHAPPCPSTSCVKHAPTNDSTTHATAQPALNDMPAPPEGGDGGNGDVSSCLMGNRIYGRGRSTVQEVHRGEIVRFPGGSWRVSAPRVHRLEALSYAGTLSSAKYVKTLPIAVTSKPIEMLLPLRSCGARVRVTENSMRFASKRTRCSARASNPK